MKEKNIKLTKQRTLILDVLRNNYSHPTAEELYKILKKKDPSIGYATVYRNLEKFYELNLIGKIPGRVARYDGNIKPHNHIKCVKCERVFDTDIDIFLDNEKIKNLGYKLDNYSLKINVICKDCQKKEEEKK
jgi:Fur family transcriptional regulator, peroxide stress response regulator